MLGLPPNAIYDVQRGPCMHNVMLNAKVVTEN